MPKAFDQREQDIIRQNLMRVGLRHFERMGVRGARVDAICSEVGIAKGSFYAFFPSKEELFMAIVEAREDQHQADMLTHIAEAKGGARRRAGGFFDLVVKKIESDPVLNLVLANEEIAHLMRKLGPERFAAGQRKDRLFAEEAAKRWSAQGELRISPADLLGLMTITLAVATQRRHMTAAQYAPSIALLREMFVERLTRGAK